MTLEEMTQSIFIIYVNVYERQEMFERIIYIFVPLQR